MAARKSKTSTKQRPTDNSTLVEDDVEWYLQKVMKENQINIKEKLEPIFTAVRTQPNNGNTNEDVARKYEAFLLGVSQVMDNNNIFTLHVGQRRIKAYIQLGIREISFYRVSLEQIILGEFHANSNRKDFTSSERVTISKAVEEFLRRHSKSIGRPRSVQKSDKTTTKDSRTSPDSKNEGSESNAVKLTTFSGRVKDNVSRYFGISRNTLEKEKEIVNAAEQNPELFGELVKKVDLKKISVDKAFHEIQKQIKKAQFLASGRSTTNNASLSNINLMHGDFRQLSKTISNDSIDLIFTDPPYAAEYVPLYEDLAVTAYNVLKEGGSLVTYVGHYAIPEVIEIMKNAGLTYWWPIAVVLSGSFAKHYPKQVTIKWKPLLWFVKGDKLSTTDFLSDLIKSDTPSKVIHEWEQSIVEIEHIISRLTVEGQTVLDPMMGSGTTGTAAVQNDRKFIGIEIDSDKFEIAKARIGKIISTIRTETKDQKV